MEFVVGRRETAKKIGKRSSFLRFFGFIWNVWLRDDGVFVLFEFSSLCCNNNLK